MAFYDALEVNDSAVKVLGDEVLRDIARELTESLRRNTTIDWTVRESVRAKIRVSVKRILRKHGYPPDKELAATRTVLEQAELLCKDWGGGARRRLKRFTLRSKPSLRPVRICFPSLPTTP